MAEPPDYESLRLQAREILSTCRHAFMATVDQYGAPWNEPVPTAISQDSFHAPIGLGQLRMYFQLDRRSRQDSNLRYRQDLFFNYFDPTIRPGTPGRGVYLRAEAYEITNPSERTYAEELISLQNRQTELTIRGAKHLKIYGAVASSVWTNGVKAYETSLVRDYRVPLQLSDLRNLSIQPGPVTAGRFATPEATLNSIRFASMATAGPFGRPLGTPVLTGMGLGPIIYFQSPKYSRHAANLRREEDTALVYAPASRDGWVCLRATARELGDNDRAEIETAKEILARQHGVVPSDRSFTGQDPVRIYRLTPYAAFTNASGLCNERDYAVPIPRQMLNGYNIVHPPPAPSLPLDTRHYDDYRQVLRPRSKRSAPPPSPGSLRQHGRGTGQQPGFGR